MLIFPDVDVDSIMSEEKLRREIRAIKEILAVKHYMHETGDWNGINKTHMEVCVPAEYRHLDEMDVDSLQIRRKRLEQDLRDLQRREDECEFNRSVELRRGKRIEDEE